MFLIFNTIFFAQQFFKISLWIKETKEDNGMGEKSEIMTLLLDVIGQEKVIIPFQTRIEAFLDTLARSRNVINRLSANIN